MKIVSRILLVLVTIQLVACASVFAPKKEKVVIVTGNTDATVTLDGEIIGTGDSIPSVIRKRRGGTDAPAVHNIKIETPGYKTSYQTIVPSHRMAAFWPIQAPAVILFFIPTFIDLGGRLPFVFENVHTVSPSNKFAERDSSQMFVGFAGFTWNDSSLVENFDTYSGKLKNSPSKEFYLSLESEKNKSKSLWRDTQISFERTLSEYSSEENISKYLYMNGFVDTISEVFHDDNQTIQLVGDIRKITRYETKVKGFDSQECYKVELMWYLHDQYGVKLDSIPDYDFSGEIHPSYSNLISDAIENSFVKVTNSKLFFEKSQRISNYELDFTQLSLNKPLQVVRNSKEAFDATVTIETDLGFGSGFAVTNDGYLLTNYHVIANAKSNSITVLHPNGNKYPAEIVRTNKYQDIALLKIDQSFDKAFVFDSNKMTEKYQKVYTIGCPKSIELTQSFTQGIISNERKKFGSEYLQLHMPVNSGNSGGPVFDKNGILSGIIVSKLMGYSIESIGFAIPSYKIPNYLRLNYN